MAGMFYSLEEAAEKLGLAQEDVKQLAAEGKLREFRDGASMMFKVDEVDALRETSEPEGAKETSRTPEGDAEVDEADDLLNLESLDEGLESGETSDEILLESLDEAGPSQSASEEDKPQPAAQDSEAQAASDDDVLLESLDEAEPSQSASEEDKPQPAAQGSEAQAASDDDVLLESLDETGLTETVSQEQEAPLTLEPEAGTEETTEEMDEDLDALLGFAEEDDQETPEPVQEEGTDQDDLSLVEPELEESEASEAQDNQDIDLADTQLVAEESQDTDKKEMDDSVQLAKDETGDTGTGDLTDMDTAFSGQEGISVLGETDGDFKLTDDTMAETLAGLGASGETSLEEIEDDMSLDSAGSGSGLLDLSLQADDTSLGGILDEIYTTEGADVGAPQENVGTTEEVVAESETLPVESGIESEDEFVPAAMPMTSVGTVADLPADASSRMLGGLLFIPIFVLLYTGVIAVSGMMGNTPSILSSIQSFIWYVLGGLAMLAVILSVVGLTRGNGSTRPAKAKKAKKEKAPKKAKAKKEKGPKAKKEKKSLFAKKKKK